MKPDGNTGVLSNSLISMDFDFDSQNPSVVMESEPELISISSGQPTSDTCHTYTMCAALLLMTCGIKLDTQAWDNGSYTYRHEVIDNIIREHNSTACSDMRNLMLAEAIFLLFFNTIIIFGHLCANGSGISDRSADCIYAFAKKWVTAKRKESDINLFILNNLSLFS